MRDSQWLRLNAFTEATPVAEWLGYPRNVVAVRCTAIRASRPVPLALLVAVTGDRSLLTADEPEAAIDELELIESLMSDSTAGSMIVQSRRRRIFVHAKGFVL